MVDVTLATGIVATAATLVIVLLVLGVTALSMQEDRDRAAEQVDEE